MSGTPETQEAASICPGDESAIDPRWQERLGELLRISRLPEDWDGAGAARPQSDVTEAAIEWLQNMAVADPAANPPTSVAASPGGEIIFVWQDDDLYLEAEVVAPGRVEWMRSVPGKPIEHWQADLHGVVSGTAHEVASRR